MQRILITIVVLATFMMSSPSTEAHTGYYRNVGNQISLRTGPAKTYATIGAVLNWDVVKVYGHQGDWFKVTVLRSGKTGWAWRWNFNPSSYTPPPPAPVSYTICLTNYWGVYVCSGENVGHAIRYWAAQYGLGWWQLAATAACESDFKVNAYNPASGVSGIFQFMPSTFYWQGGTNLWDPWDQSRIAAKMFANGLAYHWHCAQLLGIA